MHKIDGFVLIEIHATHILAVIEEGDRVRRPLHLVGVPSSAWVCVVRLFFILTVRSPIRMEIVVDVLVVLSLCVTIAVDDVCRYCATLNRGDDIHVDLVPATGVEVRAVPVCEEGGNSSLLVGRLHTGDELSVGEFLGRGDSSTFPIGLGNANDGE